MVRFQCALSSYLDTNIEQQPQNRSTTPRLTKPEAQFHQISRIDPREKYLHVIHGWKEYHTYIRCSPRYGRGLPSVPCVLKWPTNRLENISCNLWCGISVFGFIEAHPPWEMPSKWFIRKPRPQKIHGKEMIICLLSHDWGQELFTFDRLAIQWLQSVRRTPEEERSWYLVRMVVDAAPGPMSTRNHSRNKQSL